MITISIHSTEINLTLQEAVTLRNELTAQINALQTDVAKWLNRLPEENKNSTK